MELFSLQTHLLSKPLEVSGRLKVSEKLKEPKEFKQFKEPKEPKKLEEVKELKQLLKRPQINIARPM